MNSHRRALKKSCNAYGCALDVFSRHLWCRKHHFALTPLTRQALWKLYEASRDSDHHPTDSYTDALTAGSTLLAIQDGFTIRYKTLHGDRLYQHRQSTFCVYCVHNTEQLVLTRLSVTLHACSECDRLFTPVLKGQQPLPGLEASV